MSDTEYDYGFGHGYGYGYGYDYGYDYGFGDGFGFGDGDGYGHGDGYSTIIATIAGYEVRRHTPFAAISVGCETHTIEHWREHWREIADKHNVDVSEEDVEKILREVSCE